MSEKRVYFFGGGKAEGTQISKNILGGKGLGLAKMVESGVPVPAGFTIITNVCDYYVKNRSYPEGLTEEVDAHVKNLEEVMGAEFGNPDKPLLVSVRSGAAVSMPGMMDTILNLGMNDEVVQGLAKKTQHDRFAWDSYRRFMQMFGSVAMGVPHDAFEHALEEVKEEVASREGKSLRETKDTDLTAEDLKKVVEKYKEVYKKAKGEDFPADPKEQLWHAITAVFSSWDNPRAISYRRMNDIKGLLGTAVNVQAMVFGNMGGTSATGVCFSRNPSTGENKFYGEFLINAQGEDVVAGIRTPQEITLEGSKLWAQNNGISEEERKAKYPSLEEEMPEVYKLLVQYKEQLENYYNDMQDMEFTIQDGTLYMLQTRTGKRTAEAAVRIAVEMVEEGRISEKEAVLRVLPEQLDQLLHPAFDEEEKKKSRVLAKGLNASPGAAVGKVAFSAEKALEMFGHGDKTILVRIETSPEDIEGMHVSKGILTARGGATSHAAVVARGMGKPCVAGCGSVEIDYSKKQMVVDGETVKEGDFISIDGSTGEVMLGSVATKDPELSGEFAKLMSWADSFRKMKVRTNADTPKDSEVARRFGAEGIGLCRTEHMFFESDRIGWVRQMILVAQEVKNLEALMKKTDDENEIAKLKAKYEEPKRLYDEALEKLLPVQKKDFFEIFTAMKGLPVTIRLLDPPLHEFLPHEDKDINELAKQMKVSAERLKTIRDSLHEFNPMLGHRGCRLSITYPEILIMQVKAIMEAAVDIKKGGDDIVPEIMIPLVGHSEEFRILKDEAEKVIVDVLKSASVEIDYLIGTMIEVPRAALRADAIVKEGAAFFSFGTNDLTQMALGFSRDDAGKFLGHYVDMGIYDKDPFQVLDQAGVGELMKIAIEKAKTVKSDIKLGICGEHGGEPTTVMFCHTIGLTYVSCSPYRVPVARLAAAHGALKS